MQYQQMINILAFYWNP